ncbi:unnamed protein product [Sphagnum troendelagicum]|uniref:Uncharacterized protein n=1 Tax=Sphagnum troendelagicum TaxID=128251 RepID=A0ABP0UGE3_9BRYO
MVSGKMGGGLGVSSWLLIAITILVVLQLFCMAGVSGAQMSHQLHGNCLKDQNNFFECLVVPSRKLQQLPTPPVRTNSPPHAGEHTPGPPE